VKNLKDEGFDNFTSTVVKSGDVMQDGAMFYRNYARKPKCDTSLDFMLCTVHRAENTDDEVRLRAIFEALNKIGEERQVILPLHPRTKKIIVQLKIETQNLMIIEPVGYLEMVWLIDNCSLVMTDSGGLQKEAFFFEKPCITLRDETEWVELVDNGFNKLVGANKVAILDAFKNEKFNKKFTIDLYGMGKASRVIIENLLKQR